MHKSYIKREKQDIIKYLLDSGFTTVDNDGNVFAHRHGSRWGKGWLKVPKKTGLIDHKGYVISKFMYKGKGIRISNHHIVWISFNGFIPEGLQINHKDGIKHNNHPDNLELMTPKENTQHAVDIGKRNYLGENNGNSKLSYENVQYIRKNFIPYNRTFGLAALGEKFGVSSSHVSCIVRNRYWKE